MMQKFAFLKRFSKMRTREALLSLLCIFRLVKALTLARSADPLTQTGVVAAGEDEDGVDEALAKDRVGQISLLCSEAETSHFQWVLLVASLLLVVRPGAPSSVLAPSSDALCS